MTLALTWGQRALKHAYLVEITQGGQTCYLCSIGSINLDSNRQLYRPLVIQVGDLISDNDGPQRFLIQLRMKGPYLMGGVNYRTFSHLYRAVGLEGATVTVRELAAIRSLENREPRIVNARFERPADITQSTFTLECEPRGDLERTAAPVYVLDRTTFSTDALNDRIPESSIGQAIPSNWGRALTWADHSTHQASADNHTHMNQFVSACGIPPVVHPCVEVQREHSRSFWAFAEWINATGQLDPESFLTQPCDVWTYVDQAEAWARAWTGTSGGVVLPSDRFDSKCRYIILPRTPYLRLPLIASSFDASMSQSGITNPERALDGRQDTFAIIPHAGATPGACYELRNDLTPLGHISHNTTDNGTAANDFEEPGSPAGITAFALISWTSGDVLPTTGSVYLRLRFPGSNAEVFNTTPYLNANFTTAERYYRLTHHVRAARSDGVTGTADSGWADTHMAEWIFNAQLSGPLSDGTGDVRAFRVELFNNMGVPLKLHSIGLQVTYKSSISEVDQLKIDQTFFENEWKRFKPNLESKIPQPRSGRHGWTRGALLSSRTERYTPRRIGVSCNSYRDDASGTYSNQASTVIQNPVATMYNLIRAGGYGGRTTDTFITGSTFGSWDTAVNLLDRWAQIADGPGSGRKWTQRVVRDERRTISQNLDAIRAMLPTTHIRKNENGAWECHVWIPSEADWPASALYGTIDPDEMLCLNAEGADLQLSKSGESEIVNEIEIRYGFDSGPGKFNRTARVTASQNDDGANGIWPVTPITGVTAEQLVAWSQSPARYGKRIDPTKYELATTDDPTISVAVGCSQLWHYHLQRPLQQFYGTLQIRDLVPGKIFQWDTRIESRYGYAAPFWGNSPSPPQENTSWSSIYWLCTAAEKRGGKRLIKAEWLPRVVGAQVLGGGFLGGEIGVPGQDVGGPQGPIGEM